jgi:hypothetical protein
MACVASACAAPADAGSYDPGMCDTLADAGHGDDGPVEDPSHCRSHCFPGLQATCCKSDGLCGCRELLPDGGACQ